MPTQLQTRANRNLTLTLASFLALTNTLTLLALSQLPARTSTPLTTNFTLYILISLLISLLGLYGTLRPSPTLLHIFSNHLLLDALLSTIPRFLLLGVFVGLPSSMCAHFPGHSAAIGDDGRADAPWQWDPLVGQQCRVVLWALGGAGVLCMLGLTGLQWACAWRVREFAVGCEEEHGGACVVVEKKEALLEA